MYVRALNPAWVSCADFQIIEKHEPPMLAIFQPKEVGEKAAWVIKNGPEFGVRPSKWTDCD